MPPKRSLAFLAMTAALLAACQEAEVPAHLQIPGAEPALGAELIFDYGCGSCHIIDGIPGALGRVGPPLTDFAARTIFAGQFANGPRNLVPFILDPPALAPGTAMPEMGVGPEEARHMAAYLYTLGAEHAHPWPSTTLPLVPPAIGEAMIGVGADSPVGVDNPAPAADIPIDRAMEMLAEDGEAL